MNNNIYTNRKQIRLQNYDYRAEGYYFVTICTYNKKCLFSEIKEGTIIINEKGLMIRKFWQELENKYGNIKLDEYIIMPNHLHGIININKYDEELPRIIDWFKTMTTNEYIKNVKKVGWERYENKLWQRSYYEHVIRNEKELYEIRYYIKYNPLTWKKDSLFYNNNYI